MFHFGQINLQHSRSATAIMYNYVYNKKCTFVYFLTEPYLVQGKITGLGRSGKLISGGESPRAAIWTNTKANIWPVSSFTSRDMATCRLDLEHEQIYLASVYCDINDKKVIPVPLIQLVEHCINSNFKLIIAADSNAHSVLWNEAETNK